jgi:hypothetical protein
VGGACGTQFDDTRLPTDAGSRWTSVPGSLASLSLLITTPYSFAILPSYELLSVPYPPSQLGRPVSQCPLAPLTSWTQTRGLGAASIRKPSGHVVHPSAESVRSTIDDQVRGQDGIDLNYNSLTRCTSLLPSFPPVTGYRHRAGFTSS